MSALSAYYDHLLPELPGCTTAMVDLHLRAMVRDFCKRTSVWRQDLAAINLVANQASYTLVTPADSEVVRVTALKAASELLWVDTDRQTDGDEPKYQRGEPPFTQSTDLSQITLITDEVPAASLAGGLVVTVALRPTDTAATLPDFLLTEYLEAIRLGTLSRLMRMGGKKPWSDRVLAADYDTRFNALVNHAAYQGSVGNTRKSLRVKKWG